jgi:hypothetical protein
MIIRKWYKKPYLGASHNSCKAQTDATISKTAGTSAGVAGRITMIR